MKNILNSLSLKVKLGILFLVPFLSFIGILTIFLYQDLNSDETHVLYIVFAIVITIISILIYFYIVKNILNSISHIKGGLSRFFNYLTSTEKNLENISLDSKDDFGQMAK